MFPSLRRPGTQRKPQLQPLGQSETRERKEHCHIVVMEMIFIHAYNNILNSSSENPVNAK